MRSVWREMLVEVEDLLFTDENENTVTLQQENNEQNAMKVWRQWFVKRHKRSDEFVTLNIHVQQR